MKRDSRARAYIIYIIMATMMAAVHNASAQLPSARSISTIAQSDPLILTGAVGTQNTYYNASAGNGFRSPWNNALWGDFRLSLYGLSMPFTFYWANDNSSFSHTHLTFHAAPEYGPWRAHLGRTQLPFSSYLMNMSFNGVALEYADNRNLRFAAFYGELRPAVNDDPTDPSARSPQYRRMGWGMHAGYGTRRTFIDLYMLRAYDRQNSIDERWQQRIGAKDNIAVALRAGVGITDWLSLRGGMAFSTLTTDKSTPRLDADVFDSWEGVFKSRYTTNPRMAADISANASLHKINAQLYYRIVQPDYGSLGLVYMQNNYQGVGLSLSTSLIPKVSLSGNITAQEDNLSGNQLYTTRGFVYSLQGATQLTSSITLAAGYHGYTQRQGDGTAHVNDSTRVSRQMHSIYVTPSYTFDTNGGDLSHILSLTASLTQNSDLNRFSPSGTDVTSTAVGLQHTMSVRPWQTDVTTALSHQQSHGYHTRYTTDVLSIGASRAFLSDKGLRCQAMVSLCRNDIRNRENNFSVGADVSASYTLAHDHLFSLSAGVNKYSDANISSDHTSMGATELSVSIGYTYTLPLLSFGGSKRQ